MTIVEKIPRLIGREYEDVSQAVRDVLEAKGIVVRAGAECICFAMTRVGRAEQIGFMEVVVDAESDVILGGTIFGTGGDEAIHTVLDMMSSSATATKLRQAVHIHSTSPN